MFFFSIEFVFASERRWRQIAHSFKGAHYQQMGHSCDKHASGFIFLPLFSLLVANRITSHRTVHILFHYIVVSFNDTCMTIATDLHMSTEICAHVPNEQKKSITIWHTAACKMLSIIHQTESASRQHAIFIAFV